MQTSALITLIQKKAPKWSVENIREILNEIQNIMLMSKPLAMMRVKDSTTGEDYKFTASTSTYEYTVNTFLATAAGGSFPYDAAFVHAVYTSDPNDPDDGVTIIPATPSSAAKIIFDDSPSGDHYVWYYRKPTQITSTSVQLTVPQQYHLSVVHEGVVGMIEQFDNGESRRWEKFEQVLLPRFWYGVNTQGTWQMDGSTLRGY